MGEETVITKTLSDQLSNRVESDCKGGRPNMRLTKITMVVVWVGLLLVCVAFWFWLFSCAIHHFNR